MANDKLQRAKDQKNDEFYTQYFDIEAELNNYLEYNPDVFKGKTVLLPCDDPEWSNFTRYFAQNFDRFGLKKLISTSYAIESKKYKSGFQLSLLETEDPQYDPDKSKTNGKIFILERKGSETKIDINNLEWHYLDGDGDFRSNEVKKLRDEADIIVTNPPFTLFKEFISWILEANKKFITIGNLNAITYKEIFPLIMNNKIWLGATTFTGGAAYFMGSPELYDPEKMSNPKHAYIKDGVLFWRVNGVRWFTNMEIYRRHEPSRLMTMADNVKFNKKILKRFEELNSEPYPKYDNYDAIEVPYADAIPSDYKGIMGVPISFLEKHNPDEFEIIGMCENLDLYHLKTRIYSTEECRKRYREIFGKPGTYDLNASGVVNGLKVYQRILIKAKE